jgi:transcriptional repressor NrdR
MLENSSAICILCLAGDSLRLLFLIPLCCHVYSVMLIYSYTICEHGVGVKDYTGMKCSNCHHCESKVVESRDVASGEAIRRRRECLACGHRYTTYERLERPALTVVKKDGTRQLYNRDKLMRGLQRSCDKTTITSDQFDDLVSRIEKAVYDQANGEIPSNQIGDIVMDALAETNQVAYVRFASVYRSFADIESFERELERIKAKTNQATI